LRFTLGRPRPYVIAATLALACLSLTLAVRVAAQDNIPEVAYPTVFRGWTHVKSAVVGPANPACAHFGGLHSIYANAKAMKGGSISAPGVIESFEHKFPKDHPLRALYLVDRAPGEKPEPTFNMLLKDGVKSCLAYAKGRDRKAAKALANPDNAPHVRFVDMAGHGYAVVRASQDRLETEFACIVRPVERATTADGGPLRYRVRHTAKLWRAGETPRLEAALLEGDAGLSWG
jgi:hypothetical protein